MKKRLISFVIIVLTLYLCGCGQKDAVPVASEKQQINTSITLVAVGDNLLHMPVIRSGLQADGSYDFSHIFEKLQPTFKNADLAVIGQETVFGGEHLGYSGYQIGRAHV